MTDPNLITLNTRLTSDQVNALDRIAEARGQSRAAVIRWLIAEGITRFFMSDRPTDRPIGTSENRELSAA